MFLKKIIFDLLSFLCKSIVAIFSLFNKSGDKTKDSIIFIWTSEIWGIILSGSLLFSALKKKYPNLKITLVVNPDDVSFFKYNDIKRVLGLNDEDEIIGTGDIITRMINQYDAVVVPSVSGFSIKDHLLAGILLANAKIGFSESEGSLNPYRSVLSIKKANIENEERDSHFIENIAALISDTSFNVDNIFDQISYTKISLDKAKILQLYNIPKNCRLVGFSNQADLASKKWDNEKIIRFVQYFSKIIEFKFFIISDMEDAALKKLLAESQIDSFFVESGDRIGLFYLMNVSDLIITMNTNIMHLAGITKTPQISLFGDHNPFKWAPVGEKKSFLKKSDFVNSISAEDLIGEAKILLKI